MQLQTCIYGYLPSRVALGLLLKCGRMRKSMDKPVDDFTVLIHMFVRICRYRNNNTAGETHMAHQVVTIHLNLSIHSFIVHEKKTQITVNAAQCKMALWSSVHWQLQV